jgi:hypothetical protein
VVARSRARRHRRQNAVSGSKLVDHHAYVIELAGDPMNFGGSDVDNIAFDAFAGRFLDSEDVTGSSFYAPFVVDYTVSSLEGLIGSIEKVIQLIEGVQIVYSDFCRRAD